MFPMVFSRVTLECVPSLRNISVASSVVASWRWMGNARSIICRILVRSMSTSCSVTARPICRSQ